MRWTIALVICALALVLAISSQAETETTQEQKRVERRYRRGRGVGIIPMFGVGAYSGTRAQGLTSNLGGGLVLDLPVAAELFSLEIEGSYFVQEFQASFRQLQFDRFTLGGNFKMSHAIGIFRPSVGLGLLGIYYSGFDTLSVQSQWVPAAQFIAGFELFFWKHIALGLRGSYTFPFGERDTVFSPATPVLESQLSEASYYRLLGTVTFEF